VLNAIDYYLCHFELYDQYLPHIIKIYNFF